MKKRFKPQLMILMAVLVSMLMFGMSYAEDGYEFKVDVGIDGYYKMGAWVPAKVEVVNNSGDFQGELRLLIDHTEYEFEEYMTYTRQFEIAKGATKELDMRLFMDRMVDNNNKALIQMVDDAGNLIYEKPITINRGRAPEDLSIGVLSSQTTNHDYMSGIRIDENAFNMYNVLNLGGSLDEEIEYLGLIDVLLIDDYNTANFSEHERNTLKNWINSGGVLLLATGVNHEKSLNGLGFLTDVEATGTQVQYDFDGLVDQYDILHLANEGLEVAKCNMSY